MARKNRDTDYLVISARIRAMENSLLTRERMERLLEARDAEETSRLLQEYGYPALDPRRPEEMDAALAQVREATLSDLADSAPDPRDIDLFRMKYDYHNVKALLKAAAMDTDPAPLLTDAGRIPAAELREALENGRPERLPGLVAPAAEEAREVLNTTRDPQRSDLVLDRWCYRDMEAAAEAADSDFLRGYVRLQVDAVNLRTLVRSIRMGRSTDFLRDALLEGGSVDIPALLRVSAEGGAGLAELFAPTELAAAAEAGAALLKGGAMTEFERLCDDGVSEYLSGAQLISFGEAPLVGYLAARETEYTNLRILLLGRGAGLAPDLIRARLRRSYV